MIKSRGKTAWVKCRIVWRWCSKSVSSSFIQLLKVPHLHRPSLHNGAQGTRNISSHNEHRPRLGSTGKEQNLQRHGHLLLTVELHGTGRSRIPKPTASQDLQRPWSYNRCPQKGRAGPTASLPRRLKLHSTCIISAA